MLYKTTNEEQLFEYISLMKLIKILGFLYKSEHPHFVSVEKTFYFKWKWLIRLAIGLNSNYKSCEIFRKKYKAMRDIVVVGLKSNGINVKRRTAGIAKSFVTSHRNAKCLYCEVKLTLDNATVDHIIPISKNGTNSQVNLIICCHSCNSERGNLPFMEYLKMKNPKYQNLKYISI